MIRSILVLGVSALALSACGSGGGGGGGNSDVKKACASIMSDPEPAGELAENDVSVDGFCDCLTGQLAEMPDADAERMRTTMIAVAPGFEEGRSGQEIYSELREKGQADDATPADVEAYENMDDLGEFLEDVIDGMASNGGACPAA
ncbi:hypothetical protein [Henriciella litoralis]|uniref:hypothetical protein n=1 Tax=Henriciella litoralis TaxID=568102 RepID=UPI000A071DCD|nr:hypothetical protein [Henriciella litoralis]